MKLVLLGTAGYHPNEQRHTPCILVPECGVMFDAGTGMFRAARFLQTAQLDIFLSHAHLDHVVGLTYLLSVMRSHPLDRVTVHGDAAKLAAIDDHVFCEALFPKRPPYESRPLRAEVGVGGEGRVTHFPLEHQGGSIGFRVDWPGRSLAYVTDTTASPDADYVERIAGVDLLLHECYFPDARAEWAALTGHSCTTPVAQLARAAGVGRLILIHVDPTAAGADPIGLDVARAVFPATELGADLMEIEF